MEQKNIKYLNELREFVSEWKEFVPVTKREEVDLSACKREANPMDGLYALVVDYVGDVCHPEFITKILTYNSYHMDHMAAGCFLTPKKRRNPMTSKLFHMFVTEVSRICHVNAIENIKSAKQTFEERSAKAQVNGERPDEQTRCMKSGATTIMPWRHDELDISKATECDVQELEKLFYLTKQTYSEITGIDQLTPMLVIDRPDAPSAHLRLQPKLKTKYESLITTCKYHERIYENVIMSMVRLASIGYAWRDEAYLPEYTAQDDVEVYRNWLSLTQACYGVLRTHVEFDPSISSEAMPTFTTISNAKTDLADTSDNKPDVLSFQQNVLDHKANLKGSEKYHRRMGRKQIMPQWLKTFGEKFETQLISTSATQVVGIMSTSMGALPAVFGATGLAAAIPAFLIGITVTTLLGWAVAKLFGSSRNIDVDDD